MFYEEFIAKQSTHHQSLDHTNGTDIRRQFRIAILLLKIQTSRCEYVSFDDCFAITLIRGHRG